MLRFTSRNGVDSGLGSEADFKTDSMRPAMTEQMSDNLSETARDKLRLTVERIERLEEEKKEIAEQIKEVYGEAKALGYDTKALRTVVKLRKQDRQERQEQEAILEVYLDALGEL
jgi:uncharacterized protein (UPF0335 family)